MARLPLLPREDVENRIPYMLKAVSLQSLIKGLDRKSRKGHVVLWCRIVPPRCGEGIVSEGEIVIRDLLALGACFTVDDEGELSLAREVGMSFRVVRADDMTAVGYKGSNYKSRITK